MKKFLLMSLALFGSMTAAAQTGPETTATEQPKCVLLVSPQQFVDGGKYIIAAFNYSWGTTNPYDHLRFWKFENNQHKFVKAANIGDVNSIIWTANRFTCTNTCTHPNKITVQLRHGDDQYIQLANGGATPAATTTNHTSDAKTILEFFTDNPPANTTYYLADEHTKNDPHFNIHFLLSGGHFTKALSVNGSCTSGQCGVGNTTLVETYNRMLYGKGTNANSTFFYIWRVIETGAELGEHATNHLDGLLEGDKGHIGQIGYYTVPNETELAAIAAKTSAEAVTQEEVDEYNNAAMKGNIHSRILQKPAFGSYLKFKVHFDGFGGTAALYYNTQTGNGTPGASRQSLYTGVTDYNADDAIVYYDNNNLLSYTTGYYLGIRNSSIHWLKESDLTETGGNAGAPIYLTHGYTAPGTHQMNSVINNTPWHCIRQEYLPRHGILITQCTPVAVVRNMPREAFTHTTGTIGR